MAPMNNQWSDGFLFRVATLYFTEELSQSAIANQLGISRSNVAKIIAAAKQRGIVSISVQNPTVPAFDTELANSINQALPSPVDIYVVLAQQDKPDEALRLVSSAASDYLKTQLHALHSIGIGWGRSVRAMINALGQVEQSQSILIRPFIGGSTETGHLHESGSSILMDFSRTLGAKAQPLFAPAILDSKDTFLALMRERSILSALNEAGTSEIGFVGIGVYGKNLASQVISQMKLDDKEIDILRRQEPVGDICGKFFDINGRQIIDPVYYRVLGLDLDDFSSVNNLVGLAAGAEKALGVIGALRTGTLDTLFIDSLLAEQMLRHLNS